MFCSDLIKKINRPVRLEFVALSSYGDQTHSSGQVRIDLDISTNLEGKNILIVEDIVDSGLTLSWLRANLMSRGAASVEVLAILRKPEAAKVEVTCKYVGFDIPPDFVVGYGLDFNEKYRNLPFIGVLAKHIYS